MAYNKHLVEESYRRAAVAVCDDTEWFDADLPEKAHAIVCTRLGRELNQAELGEIWTHVIGLDFQYAVLAGAEAEQSFIALGTEVVYDEPDDADETASSDESCKSCTDCQ
jgi:hypothetical protein